MKIINISEYKYKDINIKIKSNAEDNKNIKI